MSSPPPDPEHVVRAWELHVEGRSLATIRETLRKELGEANAPRSRETVRSWIKQGRAAAAWLEEDAKAEAYTGPEHVRAKFVEFLDRLIERGFDELDGTDAQYKDVAPVMLRAAQEQARVVGAYAPVRVDVGPGPAAPDPQTAAVVKAMEQRAAAREQELRSSGGTE